MHSARKSTRRASQKLGIPQQTVWRVLRRRLVMQPYKLHIMQTLHAGDRAKCVKFSNAVLPDIKDNNVLPCLIFIDEATFHISGKVNHHNVRIWRLQNSQKILEHLRDSPKVNVFCAISLRKVYGLSFARKTQFQDELILKCYSNDFFSNAIKILSFNKMEHYRVRIVVYRSF